MSQFEQALCSRGISHSDLGSVWISSSVTKQQPLGTAVSGVHLSEWLTSAPLSQGFVIELLLTLESGIDTLADTVKNYDLLTALAK